MFISRLWENGSTVEHASLLLINGKILVYFSYDSQFFS